ncbi:hypothetical protein RHGRI_019462 [Rhododendron griersonianum]|uniref:Pentatricopeptide repeat-containing protein n=1 Tax=Rhododendron griersonianum TaxID=479676 RepID=A0AAV6JH54_9ERIC|nr:hypothetical protein RHGRI_019462 [Rhododendron griersonianum]
MNVLRRFNPKYCLFPTPVLTSCVVVLAPCTSSIQGSQVVSRARKVFDEMPQKNLVSWICMVSGYVRNEMIREAREVFDTMPSRNVVSWTAMVSRVDEARELFDAMPVKNDVSWAILLEGYFHHGMVDEAEELFDQAPVKSVSLYNAR